MILEYTIIGVVILFLIYIGLRVFSFAIFRSWFQAKNFNKEDLNVIPKKTSTKERTVTGEGEGKL